MTRFERRVIDEASVTVERGCDVREVWSSRDDGVEHELFIANAPKGSGALRVRLAAKGPWLERNAKGHLFAGPGASEGWGYGTAFVVNAAGKRTPIEVLRVDGALELVVPEALLTFPLHIDPLVFPVTEHQLAPIASTVPHFSESDEADPTLTWNTTGLAVIGAWSDDRRTRAPDIFGAVITPGNGLQLQNLLEWPGIQRKPALISARDGGVIIAFEDWSNAAQPELHVARVPDVISSGQTAGISIAGGRTPCLTYDPALGPVLGFAANGTAATVVVVDDLFAGNSNATLWSYPTAAGQIVDTAIASRNGHQAMLVQTASNALFLIEDATEVPLPPTMNERVNPTLLLGDQNEIYAAWTEPLGNTTVVEHWRKTGAGQASGSIPDSFSPSLSVFENKLTVAAFTTSGADGGSRLLTLNDVTTAQFQSYAQFNLARAQNLADLTAEVRGQTLAAGWTTRSPLEQHNVEFALFTNRDGGYVSQYFPIQSQSTQRDVRVSYFGGDVGIAVWREGGDVVRARWLDPQGNPNVNFPGAFPLLNAQPGERFDGLDVALGVQDAFIAVRVEFADGTHGVRTTYLQRLTSTHRDGPSFSFQANAPTAPPKVAWDGTNFRIGVLSGMGFEVSVANGTGTSMSKLVAPRTAMNFDLDCLVATQSCAVAFWAPISGDVVLVHVEDNMNPYRVERSAGPVSLTNDGQQYVIAFVDVVSVNMVQTPMLGFGTAPSRGMPLVDSRSVQLVDEFGSPIPLESIDVVGTMPVVVALEETLRSRTWLVDVSTPAPWPFVFDALNPRGVATRTGGPQGVVAFERFTPQFNSQAWIIPFTLAPTILPDGGVDAGVDGGLGSDGGNDGGSTGADGGGMVSPDGGTNPLALNSTGCGCSSGSGASWWLLAFAVAALVSRRRNASALGVVLLLATPAFAQLAQVDQQLLSDARASGRLSNDAHSPTVAVNTSGVAMAVWVDTRRGREDLFMARTDGSSTPFARPLVLNFQPQSHPALLGAGPDFLLAWQEGTLRGTEVHLIKLDGVTLDVLAEQVRVDARAPSLVEGVGRWWIAFQATDGASGQLVVQPVEDFFTAGPTTDTFVVQGVDAGVVRTAVSVGDGYNVIAAETVDDLLFFNKGQRANVRGALMLPASTLLRSAAVHTGPALEDSWLAVEEVGAPWVDLLHFDSPTDLFPEVRTFAMRQSPTFASLKTAVVLATFDSQAAQLHFDDISLSGTMFQVPMVAAQSPSQLQSATSDVTTWFTWTNRAAPDRDISLIKLTNPVSNIAVTDLSPEAHLVQSDVHVSFQGGRGVAAWRYGKTTTFVTWIGHATGSDSITLSTTPLAVQNDPNSELIDLDVAMGASGALLVRRLKTPNGIGVEATWISRIDGSLHPVFADTSDGAPQLLFDGLQFHGAWTKGDSLTTTTYDADGGPLSGGAVMLGRIPSAFDFDCLPAPKRACLVTYDSANGPAWESFETLMPLDLPGAGPVAVANDGRSFHLLWAAAQQQRVLHATVTPPDPSLMLEGSLDLPGKLLELRAASGRPPWVAAVDSTGGLGVARLGQPGFVALGSGRGIDVAQLDDGFAVLGFTDFDDTSAAMLPHVVLVRDFSTDGGPVNQDGGVDGGPIEPKDGGSETGDGGTKAPLSLFSTSCGCSEGSVLVWALGVLMLRRRR
ncbi:MAG: hypothetical protein QM817_33600 [Archangium sp.]